MSWRTPSSVGSLGRNEYNEGGSAPTEGRGKGNEPESGLPRGTEDGLLRGIKVPLGCLLHQLSLVPEETSPGNKHFCLPRIPEKRE